jgi:hypothetical protein
MNEDKDIDELEEFSKENLLPAFLHWAMIFGAFVVIASVVMGAWK